MGVLSIPEHILTCLTAARRIIITAHEKPDGDAIGAALGLWHLLSRAGCPAVVAGVADVRPRLSFLAGLDSVVAAEALSAEEGDVLVVLDSGALDRIPAPLAALAGSMPTVCIDHHKSNTGFGQICWVDGAASSTGEMVWRLAQQAGWVLTREAAECLWVAIVTDTGRFAYDNTSGETLRVAAELVERGPVRTAAINDALYCHAPLRVLRLRQRAMASLQMLGEGIVAIVGIAQQDLNEMGCTLADTEDFVELPREIEGVEVAVFLYESDAGTTRVSMRTRGEHDAAALCAHFGGGGHARAAGCTVGAPLGAAREQIEQLLSAHVRCMSPASVNHTTNG